MELTGQQYGQLEEALLDAFRTQARLKRMLRIGLGKNLNAITTGNGLQEIVSDLIDVSQEKHWTGELIVAARQANPGNPKLLAFAQQVGLAVTMPSQEELKWVLSRLDTGQSPGFAQWFGLSSATSSRLELEKIINRKNPFLDVSLLLNKLGQIEGRICRIEIALNGGKHRPYGTGFLVAPNVLITNYHVIEPVIKGEQGLATDEDEWAMPSDVILRFDYKQLDGKTISLGTECRLATQNWLIDSSSFDQLDYALLQVDGEPGNKPIGLNSSAPQRGWIEVPSQEHNLLSNPDLFIVQHPDGKPLKLGAGVIRDLNHNKTRLTYYTNTEGGSSGSPCFNSNWELVALHHAGNFNYNQGIPFNAILKHLEERGLKGVLGEKFLPPSPPNPPSPEKKQANNTKKPDLHILQIVEDSYFVAGDGFGSYKVGTDLVVYHSMGTQGLLPIALLRITAKNPNNLQAQAILIHPKHQIIANLLVRGRTNEFRTSDLIPAYQEAAGYFLKEGRVVLRPDIEIRAGSIIEAVEPVVDDGKIIDYDYFKQEIQMRVTRVSRSGKTAQVQLVTGQWPQTGIIIIIVPIPVVTISPPVVVSPSPTPGPNVNWRDLYRKLMNFDDIELEAFLLMDFPKVFGQIGAGMRKDQKINLLLAKCRRDPASLQRLLEALKQLGIN